MGVSATVTLRSGMAAEKQPPRNKGSMRGSIRATSIPGRHANWHAALNAGFLFSLLAIAYISSAISICSGRVASIRGPPLSSIQPIGNLYDADEDELLEVLKKTPDLHETIFMVAHNPGLTSFANSLFHQTIENIPTAGMVCGQFNVTWKSIKWGSGKQIFFDYPKA